MDYSRITNPKFYSDDVGAHELFSHMRQHSPRTYIDAKGFRPFWALSKNADILEIERQNELFINGPRGVLAPEKSDEHMAAMAAQMKSLVSMDGEEHRTFRNLTKDWFLPANLKTLEQEIKALASTAIDEMLALGGECDFARDVAAYYPLKVIMMILGVPDEDLPLMLKLTQELFGADDPDLQRKNNDSSDRMATMMEFFAYFTQMTEDRRAKPGNDLASVIANARIDGELIGDAEAMGYYVIVATAGHDTTSSSTSGALLALLQQPEQLQKLLENPDLLPLAIDEAVRWVTPVKHFMRTATEDYQLHDTLIKKGDDLMLLYASGNRDEAVFDAPFEFQVDRRPNKHVAFGYGVHRCLGNMLAKMEMQAFFEVLLDRVDDIQLIGDPSWIESTFVSGLKSLPISFKAK